MKRLILHIGMTKTGTTSIQETLGKSYQGLLQAGVCYPPERPFNHSYEFAVMFSDAPRQAYYFKRKAPLTSEQKAAELASLESRWAALFRSSKADTFIISAERLSSFTAQEVRRLRTYCRQFFDHVQVIAYVRSPESAIKSQWQQYVKTMESPCSAQELLSLTKQRYSYRFLDHWIAEFGAANVSIRPFDRAAFKNGELLDDFLFSAGIDISQGLSTAAIDANQSLGKQGTAFLFEFNKHYPVFVNGERNPHRGLAGDGLHLFYKLIREANTEPLEIDLRFSKEEAASLNAEITYINALISPQDRFDQVAASLEQTVLPDRHDIPVEFYAELVNGYAKLVEQLSQREPRTPPSK